MIRRKTLLIICYILLLAGCATTQRHLSREEWMQVRNRHYANISPEQVLKAAEKLFILADNKDFKFSYNNNSLKAVRWASPFPVNIWYHWDIVAVPSGNGTDVNVSISTTAAGFGVPGGMTPHDSPDVINLFYSRLDYLLGKSTVWLSCNDYKKKNPRSSTLEALCLLAEDSSPSHP
ncbi:MAG: hypothetical protein JRJ78_10760 [Deltaproteobacteria bacterium]|nr:hypothetical protein [Deltaproteobacteria bacterium]MBW2018309.1 hypothetical protein [Deltaproteobacteria bacterium]